jgi:hypothetical protein
MSYISGKHGYTLRRSVAFVIVSALISTVLIMAGWTTTYVLTPYSAHFIANAKSELIGGSASHGGAVPLIALNSGNGELDHQVNQFFKCIKKTGHTGGTNGEPSRGEVDTCYDTVFVSGDSSSTNFGTEVDHIHSNSSHAGSQNHSNSSHAGSESESQSHRHSSHTDIFVS